MLMSDVASRMVAIDVVSVHRVTRIAEDNNNSRGCLETIHPLLPAKRYGGSWPSVAVETRFAFLGRDCERDLDSREQVRLVFVSFCRGCRARGGRLRHAPSPKGARRQSPV